MLRFSISGFEKNYLGEDIGAQARRVSHHVHGYDEVVCAHPVTVTDSGGEEFRCYLTRRELVFGAQGFFGLVAWRTFDGEGVGTGEARTLLRSKLFESDGPWVDDFVRQVIKKAGWTITHEEDLERRHKEALRRAAYAEI